MEAKVPNLIRTALIHKTEKITFASAAKIPSLSGSDFTLCWICLDETKNEPLLDDLCFCTNREVHKSCLEKWHHYSRERQEGLPPSCPACKSIYQNITPASHLSPEPAAKAEGVVAGAASAAQLGFTSDSSHRRCVSLQWLAIILFFGVCLFLFFVVDR